MICFDQNEADIEWVCQKLQVNRGYFGKCATIAIEAGGKTVVVYSSYSGVNCEVTVASDGLGWLKTKYLKPLFAYPFKQMGVRRITLLIRESNHKVTRLVEKIGFTHEGTLREFMDDGENCVIYSMTKTEYEASKYGK